MREIWHDIKGFEGVYAVSNLGRLRRINGPQKRKYPFVCKLQYDKNGYHIYRLSYHPKERTVKIHRLVAEYFLGFSDLTVNHKNGKKDDNRVANLEWLSNADNRAHAQQNGLIPRGERVGNSKLSESDVLRIRAAYLTGGATHQQLADQFGIGRKAITKIINRQRWRHV